MKKIIIFAIALIGIANLYSCKSNSADATCASAVGKYLADGKINEYRYIPYIGIGDTSVKFTFTAVTTDIFKQTNTVMKYNNLIGSTANTVPYYFKACGADVYVNSQGLNMDNQIAGKNLFVKGDRNVGTTWTYGLNGTTYYCGCTKKMQYIIFPYDTLWVDEIYMRPSPNTSVAADYYYWNDTIGVVAKEGVYELYKKNY